MKPHTVTWLQIIQTKATPGRMPLNATRRNAAPSIKRCLPPSATDASLRQSDSFRSPRFGAAICVPAHRLQRLLLPLCLRLSTPICRVCTSDILKVSNFILKEKKYAHKVESGRPPLQRKALKVKQLVVSLSGTAGQESTSCL